MPIRLEIFLENKKEEINSSIKEINEMMAYNSEKSVR